MTSDDWWIEGRRLRLGPWLSVLFERTPEGRPIEGRPGRRGPAAMRPRSYGALPIGTARAARTGPREVLVPVPEQEAVWFGFHPADESAPVAIRAQVIDGGRDAVTGGSWRDELRESPRNHLVCPPDRRMDGAATQSGLVAPFARRAGPQAPDAVARLRLVAVPGTSSSQDRPGRPPGHRLHADSEGHHRRSNDDATGGVGGPSAGQRWRLHEAVSVVVALVDPETFTATTGIAGPDQITDEDAYAAWRLP